jgi:hypothetical protein
VLSFRGQVAELFGSLVLTTLFALVAFTIWAAVARVQDLTEMGVGFFVTVAACWAILIPAKFWSGRKGDSSVRRAIMMVMGLLVGLTAFWVDGGTLGWSSTGPWTSSPQQSPAPFSWVETRLEIPTIAGYLSYFGLAFFALRWWKMADRHRPHRFSFAPVLAAGFWAFALLLIFPWTEGPLPLLLTSGIVQLVSPWDQPPAPPARKIRLRYA